MSVTCCPLSANDGPDASVIETAWRASKLDRECGECGDPISIGARYEYVRGMWDGSWSTYRTCALCVEIRDHFECEGWLYEHVWEDLEANFFPDMTAGGPCMEGLSPEAKARLFERCLAWRMR